MWSREDGPKVPCLIRLAAAFALAGLAGGCFQPLYAQRPTADTANVRAAFSHVDISLIDAPMGSNEARIAQVVRNDLLFAATGGGPSGTPLYRLRIRMTTQRSSIIVDINTGRPEFEITGLDASYTLIEIATNRAVVDSTTFARVSYDAPGEQQRFVRDRGRREAEDKAAKQLAEQIKTRLASYFVAGT